LVRPLAYIFFTLSPPTKEEALQAFREVDLEPEKREKMHKRRRRKLKRQRLTVGKKNERKEARSTVLATSICYEIPFSA
jgi:hypothetical protein